MGPGALPSKHLPPDQDQLQPMLMVLRLQVLNSWGKKSKSFTFENGEAKTQIDFIIMRSAQADQVARNAKVLFDYPVLKWRFGPVHHPVVSSVPMLHYQTAANKASKLTQPKIASHQSETSICRFRATLEAELATNGFTSADNLNAALLAASRHLETEHPASAPRVIDGLREEVKHMWQARKDMLAVVPARIITHIRRYQVGDALTQNET